jgi:tagatose-1,6-bisphosphate aldolase non-catalytic subunit AgaZ/GatZ
MEAEGTEVLVPGPTTTQLGPISVCRPQQNNGTLRLESL